MTVVSVNSRRLDGNGAVESEAFIKTQDGDLSVIKTALSSWHTVVTSDDDDITWDRRSYDDGGNVEAETVIKLPTTELVVTEYATNAKLDVFERNPGDEEPHTKWT